VSRHGFVEDCGDYDNVLAQGRWQAQLKSAIRGRRGQAFLRSLVEALDAMPDKSLAPNSLETEDGAVCALGCLARHRGIDVKTLALGDPYTEDPDEGGEWEDSDWDTLAAVFNIAPQLAREVMYENDECATWTATGNGDHPAPGEQRWQRVRAWAARQIRPTEEELGGKL
jgi:hypothetical protein